MRNNIELVGMIVALLALFTLAGAWAVSSYNDCRTVGMSSFTCFRMIAR